MGYMHHLFTAFACLQLHTLYDMFGARDSLHRRAYQHKTVKIISAMVNEILIEAHPHLKVPGTATVQTACLLWEEHFSRISQLRARMHACMPPQHVRCGAVWYDLLRARAYRMLVIALRSDAVPE